MPISYLVSTAGHAQHQNSLYPHGIRSILELVVDGARELGDEKVVGFAVPPEEGADDSDRGCICYSYPELLALAQAVAKQLNIPRIPSNEPQRIVSLLCPTGPDFLITWLALMGLGYGVVLVAPQCSPSAIQFLVEATSSTHLVVHERYDGLAADVCLPKTCQVTSLPHLPHLSTLPPWAPGSTFPRAAHPDDVSHVFHSSGTSGQPKPIPNLHGPSAAVLPRRRIPGYLESARGQREPSGDGADTPSWDAEPTAFTTTPLFHGGVSDLLRAWMARSMLYLYPSSTSPVTTPNVLAALNACGTFLERKTSGEAAPAAPERVSRFRINAFLSVPYILTMLAENKEAVQVLAGMDLVSTGGAPLDTAVGNGMVERGVKLVSRLGSSECGFLLSSYRDFPTDAEWEWLHNDSAAAGHLRFEPAEDGSGKCEMVVGPGWESKTKSNRPDQSYATGDLYEAHPTKRQVWRYAGRGDDVIVLSNGEKASPGPIETALRACPGVADVLVCGSDRTQLSALVFPTTFPPPGDLHAQLRPHLDAANQSSPSHAFVAPEMCVIVSDPARASLLPKSSKGTIQRGVAYDVYREEVEAIHAAASDNVGQNAQPLEADAVTAFLRQAVADLNTNQSARSNKKLLDSTDLFNYGVDSVKAARLRLQIIKQFAVDPKVLPSNVVFENPSISFLPLSYAVRPAKVRPKMQPPTAETSELELMQKLVERYGDFSALGMAMSHQLAKKRQALPLYVLSRESRGSLGAQIVQVLLSRPRDIVREVVCLVRAPDDKRALQRVRMALRERQLDHDPSRLQVLAASLGDSRLGLDSEQYRDLEHKIDVVIHAAWAVHFGSRLESFEQDHIAGVRNLLDLAAATANHAQFLFCSSLAAVLGSGASKIEEVASATPKTAAPVGYARSKWVAEQICHRASQNPRHSDRVAVLRIGQLCGDTRTGRWNETEGWPLMFRTAQTTGSLPLLDEAQSWLPSDIAAEAVVDVALSRRKGLSHSQTYHVVNPQWTQWSDILESLAAAGFQFEAVKPAQWVQRVEDAPEDEEDPSKHMLPLWRRAYGHEPFKASVSAVDSEHAQAISPALRACGPVSAEQLAATVRAWRATGFLQQRSN